MAILVEHKIKPKDQFSDGLNNSTQLDSHSLGETFISYRLTIFLCLSLTLSYPFSICVWHYLIPFPHHNPTIVISPLDPNIARQVALRSCRRRFSCGGVMVGWSWLLFCYNHTWSLSHRIHIYIWYILPTFIWWMYMIYFTHIHLVDLCCKCMDIYHTWILWAISLIWINSIVPYITQRTKVLFSLLNWI